MSFDAVYVFLCFIVFGVCFSKYPWWNFRFTKYLTIWFHYANTLVRYLVLGNCDKFCFLAPIIMWINDLIAVAFINYSSFFFDYLVNQWYTFYFIFICTIIVIIRLLFTIFNISCVISTFVTVQFGTFTSCLILKPILLKWKCNFSWHL